MRIARKCSYCGNFGHNSRTCNNTTCHKQFDIYSSSSSLSSYFVPKKSFDTNYPISSQISLSISSSSSTLFHTNENSNNHLKSDFISTIGYSKKGMPWSEEEHQRFLRGLVNLGKGNWRGIARDFVTTRTPTQVASHAQKYFLRQSQNSLINRGKHHHLSLLNVEGESKTSFEAISHPQYSNLKWPTTSIKCTPPPEIAAPDLELKLSIPIYH